MPDPNQPAPAALAFPDRKVDGCYPVVDQDDRPVASIRASWHRGSFEAVDVDGAPLCAGKVRRGGFSRYLDATGPDGQDLVSLKTGMSSTTKVEFADGRRFELKASTWGSRDWRVLGDDEIEVLSSEPRTGWFGRHPHDWAVIQNRPEFTLAELVALVELHRTYVRMNESAAASAAS